MAKMKEAISFFEKEGFEVGVWTSSLGYGGKMPPFDEVYPEYQRLVNFDGNSGGAACTTDKKFLELIKDNIRDFAKAGAKFILMDDELVQSVRPGFTCVCPGHLAMLKEATGKDFTREQVRDLFSGAPSPDRTAFLDVMGKSMEEVKAAAEKAIANIRTMGMAMSPCTLPAVGKPGFTLGEDECEIGMGIHGEPGINREKMSSAKELAAKLLQKIFDDCDYSGAEVAVMVNGLGGTPLMEQYILYDEVERILAEKNIRIYKAFVGNYMTSLEMAGVSITLFKLDDELKGYLDYPCDAAMWRA